MEGGSPRVSAKMEHSGVLPNAPSLAMSAITEDWTPPAQDDDREAIHSPAASRSATAGRKWPSSPFSAARLKRA